MGTNSVGCTEWERDFDPMTEQPRSTSDARDLAYYLEKEGGKPGVASVIHGLVAEVERLRSGAERYWEARWRDEARENDRLRAALVRADGSVSVELLQIEREVTDDLRKQNDKLRAELDKCSSV
jgi:hypothetical protein